ncbi:winged helix-turn-helix transcriptional regulator [Cohnella silvisoli]|uniref:Helix-turn-helix domain-containing protein n=1 Tax=Cohnella silvisoli TaxID=2873699 RepID=A0ABV1L3P7_9BACL|nr:helix-turn-helix domain-containing protein [Cohnella silvisoli]MCD9025727.1 helix-turn-helix transcriptional regulator [Cohnella silvisoli]
MDCIDNSCPVEATLSVIGGKWKVIILWRLVNGTKRFNELQHSMPQITRKMLTQQLRELENDGLIIRTVYPQVPPKVEYSLSDYGKSFNSVMESMAHWGFTHMERSRQDQQSM